MHPLNNRDYNTLYSRNAAQAVSSFMNKVYLWMMVGIAISGITAFYVVSQPGIMGYILQHPLILIGLFVLQIIAVIGLSARVQSMSVGVASTIFALYATLTGVTLSTLALIYTKESISNAFFVTAFAFGGLSLFGYTTKKDLGPIGSFCMMGLFGLIGVMILGLFFPSMMSNGMQIAVSVLGVLIFSGLTAYDTQRIKSMQSTFTTADEARKGAISAALALYLDFINLFISILRLMGDRR